MRKSPYEMKTAAPPANLPVERSEREAEIVDLLNEISTSHDFVRGLLVELCVKFNLLREEERD